MGKILSGVKKIEKNKLIAMIQDLRKEMQQIAKEKGMHDKTVLDMSQELDKLLNIYENLINNKE